MPEAMPEFDISCEGNLMFNGSRDFWACAVDDYGIQNLYTEPVPNQLKCIYVTVMARIEDGDVPTYTGCKKSPLEPYWIWPWDKFYNNSLPAQPSTPEGISQMASYLKDNQHAASNATTERPKGKLGVQSSDGRCGAPTGFHCFGKTDGPCCSPHGWCGFSPLHCGAGCQGDFGICDGSSSGKAPNGTSTSSKVASTASPIGNALNGTSSKALSKTSSPGKAPSSTSSKASSKTSSAGKAPSSSVLASLKASATSALKQGALSPDGQCGGHGGYDCNGFEFNNGTYPSPLDCSDPANAQKCGDKFVAYGCPHDLEGTFESPQLMVTVDKAHPDKALDNRFDGTIGDEYCTLYNFDVRASNAGKKCSLVWLFPETEEEDLEPPVFDAHGGSNSPVLMEFWHVGQPASHGLTW
ncbi:uncharacterized protein N0V89_008702 [Didymosphaeria variabile]|uniref:Chitin-binding type-1 domain-containing protein n=1 Tax=Didymosphaeria variabile TaxID=1932322 RepID=A0A9W8XG85_9PLEO|nr:uncharacterized protein N0V89_008702 [Didymosphaeria variabile]KAJ4350081.1 hypothetical protein N0V89_008702 [Didymosphaeria variabile]